VAAIAPAATQELAREARKPSVRRGCRGDGQGWM